MDFSDSVVSSFTEEYLETCKDWMPDSKDSCGHRSGKSGGKPVPVYAQHHYAPAGVEIPSPLATHHRWDCSGCVNIHHCLLLGYVPCCCPEHSALLYGFCMASSWRTPEWFLCAQGKSISLFRVVVCTRKTPRVFAGMWCRAQLLCGGHNPMQDPRRKETGWR